MVAILTEEEANKKIAELVAQSLACLREACSIVDQYPEYGLEFSFGPAYGMGGYYDGGFDDSEGSYSSDKGWHPSSMSC